MSAGLVLAVALPLLGAGVLAHDALAGPAQLPAPTAGAGQVSRQAVPAAPTALPAQPGLPAPPTGLAAPMAKTLPRSRPVEVSGPEIGRVTGLVELGLHADGSLEVPTGPERAGWWAGGVSPGEPGPAVLVGHVVWGRRPAVFHDLSRLRPGQLVQVTRADGHVVPFRVRTVESFPKDGFPTERVYAPTPDSQLRLITCGGRWDGRRYEDNVVVFADRAVDPG